MREFGSGQWRPLNGEGSLLQCRGVEVMMQCCLYGCPTTCNHLGAVSECRVLHPECDSARFVPSKGETNQHAKEKTCKPDMRSSLTITLWASHMWVVHRVGLCISWAYCGYIMLVQARLDSQISKRCVCRVKRVRTQIEQKITGVVMDSQP